MKKCMNLPVWLLGVFLVPAAWAAQICDTSTRESRSANGFVVNGDGTVTHKKTGLMWKRCAEGLSGTDCAAGTAPAMTWSRALGAAKGASYAGYSDWRLPDLKELETLVAGQCRDPSIDATAFPGTPPSSFWSASPYSSSSDEAWNVHFYTGRSSSSDKNSGSRVRLVRAGQPSVALPATYYTLTVATRGSGTITSTPAGIDCGDACSASFTDVILTPTPSADSYFLGWSGACGGTGSCALKMDADKEVTATFVVRMDAAKGVSVYPLTVTSSGSGTVTSTPAGIDCGTACGANFTGGSSVTLTATPTADGAFSGWRGACGGKGPCVVTMSAAKGVTAIFKPARFVASLNDTGQIRCYDAMGAVIGCTAAGATDDGRYGRDAAAGARTLAKTGAGNAGFDFTKIANNGSALAAGAAPGSGPTGWACTRDNVTGLMWEIKTSGGLRDKAHTYTWYNGDAATNGGSAGAPSGGVCASTGRCDTEKFARDVNATKLCGHTDWRLPKRGELRSIVDQSRYNPAIDSHYFPNTVPAAFWSASPFAQKPDDAWYVFFNDGNASESHKSDAFHVRLVRTVR